MLSIVFLKLHSEYPPRSYIEVPLSWPKSLFELAAAAHPESQQVVTEEVRVRATQVREPDGVPSSPVAAWASLSNCRRLKSEPVYGRLALLLINKKL